MSAQKTESTQAPDITLTEGRALVRIGDTQVLAEVVDTPELRRQGLSGRPSLSEGEGMLFVFDNDGLHGFWMKDMKFSIDIIWFSADKRVIHIERSLDPSTYPTSYAPEQPARYVLEVPAGWAEKYRVALGDVAQF